MPRSTLPLLFLTLCSAAFAQQQVQAQRLLTPLRDAGIYHLATGTWTRGASTANLGPDTIYSATSPSGYFGSGWEGNMAIDEGILPGSTSLGTRDQYWVDCFEFAYCSQADTLSWRYEFLPSFVPCDLYGFDAANCQEGMPAIDVPGLPTAGACWTVTVDLAPLGGMCISADGGSCAPGYQGGWLGLDHFGIAHSFSTGNGGATGPVLGGYDPTWAPFGDGTCYQTAATCVAGNTARGARDSFTIDQGTITPGCYWFGGYSNPNGCGAPHQVAGAQFVMELFTDCSLYCTPPGDDHGACTSTYCEDAAGNEGDLTIDTCILNGGPGNTLTVSNAPSAQFGYAMIAPGQTAIHPIPGAQGTLCVGPSGIGRYVQDLQATGGSGGYSVDIYNNVTGGGGGGIPSAAGGGTLTVGDTWNFQCWNRIAGSSTFTEALEVTFK